MCKCNWKNRTDTMKALVFLKVLPTSLAAVISLPLEIDDDKIKTIETVQY